MKTPKVKFQGIGRSVNSTTLTVTTFRRRFTMNMHSEIITPQINPKRKISTLCTFWENSTGNLPSQRCGVSLSTRILSTGSPYQLLYPDSLLPEAQPYKHYTVTATKLLILFYSPTESLRPGTSFFCMEPRSTNKEDLLSCFLTNRILLSSHSPSSRLISPGHWSCCLVAFDF